MADLAVLAPAARSPPGGSAGGGRIQNPRPKDPHKQTETRTDQENHRLPVARGGASGRRASDEAAFLRGEGMVLNHG